MHNPIWRKVILSILVLAILTGLSGCQVGGQLAKSWQNFREFLTNLPHRLMEALANLLGGIKDIGSALIDSIKDIVGGVIGR